MTRSPRATIRPRSGKSRRKVAQLRLIDEVRYIQRRAIARDGRVVAVGPLILFSTGTGDAWVLDSSDHFAAQLARDGQIEPIDITETSTAFAIDWPGSYRIEGPAFVYIDRRSGRVSTIIGYPTHLLKPADQS